MVKKLVILSGEEIKFSIFASYIYVFYSKLRLIIRKYIKNIYKWFILFKKFPVNSRGTNLILLLIYNSYVKILLICTYFSIFAPKLITL